MTRCSPIYPLCRTKSGDGVSGDTLEAIESLDRIVEHESTPASPSDSGDDPSPSVDEDPSDSEDAPHPVDESAFFGERDHALENQLRLAGVCLLLLAIPPFIISLALNLPLPPAQLLRAAVLVWAGVSFLRLGPHGRIAASIGLGLRLLPYIDGLRTGKAVWYVVVVYVLVAVFLLWFIWRRAAMLFDPREQRKLDERWHIHRVPLGVVGTFLLIAALWLGEIVVRSTLLLAGS